MFEIAEELKKIPKKPGVYLMKDESGKIIYVGKAVNLHSRVRQYFQTSAAENPKVRSMGKLISEFEYIVTATEMESLILECNLIKTHDPKYNVKLKDDKAYPYIKVTVNEKFPKVVFTRKLEKDRAKYFGPYTNASHVHETLELARSIWPLRVCARQFPRDAGKGRPCLNYYIGRCLAPCKGGITEKEYDGFIEELFRFLNGKYEDIVEKLERGMNECSENMEFEKAADLRDKISAVKILSEKQKIEAATDEDQDVIAIAQTGGDTLAQVFFIRGGKMLGREHFMLEEAESLAKGEIMAEFVKRYYGEASFVPKEMILECEMDSKDLIRSWLSGLKGQQVAISVPQRGEKLRLVEMAKTNASLTLEQFGEHIKREKQKTEGALEEIVSALDLDIESERIRIEAYDVSNTQGFESVGSMVVFENGRPKNSDYRKFKIKGAKGPDDYACMEEIISRRFLRYINETEQGDADGKFLKLPDIIFVDGGKGQASAAQKALGRLFIDIPVCGMVKDERHRTRGLIYLDREANLPSGSEGFKLVARIQEEVHRFAVEYHRKLRQSSQVNSLLDEIKGIGPVRRKELMRHFKSVEKIREASQEDLANAPGMNKSSAKAVYGFFHGEE